MSGAGRELSFFYLSELGQLKLLTRLVRFGQILPPQEYKVLLAIFDRTYAWRKSEAVIPNDHFLHGVSGGRGELAAAPLGLSQRELERAIEGLVNVRAIRRFGTPEPITYSINLEWQPQGFRRMWEIAESDFCYRPDDN
ncbi:MAG: hypothetical protein RB191_11075 [Terriglobia bacterium]|nr:hypothetical protein [Terriglobia bacterium]